jgi:hypothetical protein
MFSNNISFSFLYRQQSSSSPSLSDSPIEVGDPLPKVTTKSNQINTNNIHSHIFGNFDRYVTLVLFIFIYFSLTVASSVLRNYIPIFN